MLDGKVSTVGPPSYFTALNRGTVFENASTFASRMSYSMEARRLAGKADAALGEILRDLTDRAVKALNDTQRAAVRTLSQNLADLARTFGSTTRLDTDIDARLAAGTPHRRGQTEKAMAEIRATGPRYMTEAQKLDLIGRMALGVWTPHDDETKTWMDGLSTTYNRDTLAQAAELYAVAADPSAAMGRCRSIIGSDAYRRLFEEQVFGSSARGLRGSYADFVLKQIQHMLSQLSVDLSQSVTAGEYMLFDTREAVWVAGSDLADIGSQPFTANTLEHLLEKLQRLEDFRNEVIDIDVSGPVDARLTWENGKNILRLSVKVAFIGMPTGAALWNQATALTAQKLQTRKRDALAGFKDWAGQYKVFDDQDVQVEVTTQEVSGGGDSCVVVKLLTEEDLTRIREEVIFGEQVAKGLSRSVVLSAWGDGAESFWDNFNPARYLVDWNHDISKLMFLGPKTTSQENREKAMHEFGHPLGLGDMYSDNSWPIAMDGVDASMVKLFLGLEAYATKDATGQITNIDGVMFDHGKKPIGKDIEMVILAFQTGQRQNFQKQGGFGAISEALNYQ